MVRTAVPVTASVTVTPAIDKDGSGGSARIVPVALAVVISAEAPPLAVAPFRFTLNVSSGSPLALANTVTEIVLAVSPGANVTVPTLGVKSTPPAALPLAVT